MKSIYKNDRCGNSFLFEEKQNRPLFYGENSNPLKVSRHFNPPSRQIEILKSKGEWKH